jgi:hypothetical protein
MRKTLAKHKNIITNATSDAYESSITTPSISIFFLGKLGSEQAHTALYTAGKVWTDTLWRTVVHHIATKMFGTLFRSNPYASPDCLNLLKFEKFRLIFLGRMSRGIMGSPHF